MSLFHRMSLISLLAVATLAGGTAHARPSLRGAGGLIKIPTAYVSTGGSVAPHPEPGRPDETLTTLTYAVQDTAEVAVQMPSDGTSTYNLKFQLSQDVSTRTKDSPAVAVGMLDQPEDGTAKAFYGVMSKRMEGSPMVFHLGVLSPGSLVGDVRPFGGIEVPLAPRFLALGEYDGLQRDLNSGLEYYVSANVASFMYLLDVGTRGLQAESITGFTFRMAF